MKIPLFCTRQLATVVFLFLLAGRAAACGLGQADPFNPLSVVRQQVATLLHQRAYKELDRLTLEYRHSDALTSDGSPKLWALHSALAPTRVCAKGKAATLAVLAQHRKLLTDWQKHSAVPETAGMALAKLESANGWRKRGDGFADSVTPAGWKALRDHANRAAGMLDKLGPAGRKDPNWYAYRLEIGRDQGWERAQVEALYREAIAAFPDYTPLYYFEADFVSARWGGSRAQFKAFVDEAERSPRNKHGPGILFARLHTAFWSTNVMEWPERSRFLQGFQNLLTRFPDVYNNNQLAYLGCQGLTASVVRDQMAIVGDRVSVSVWGSKEYAARCLASSLNAIALREKEERERAVRIAARHAERLANPPQPVTPKKKFLGLF